MESKIKTKQIFLNLLMCAIFDVAILTGCTSGSGQGSQTVGEVQFNQSSITLPVGYESTVKVSFTGRMNSLPVNFMTNESNIVSITPSSCTFSQMSNECEITISGLNPGTVNITESSSIISSSQIVVQVVGWVRPGYPLFSESNITMTIGASKTVSASIVGNYPGYFLPNAYEFALSNESSITMTPQNCDFKDNNNLCYFTFHALESGITYIFESNVSNPVNFVELHVN